MAGLLLFGGLLAVPGAWAQTNPSIQSAVVKSSAPYAVGDAFRVEVDCTNDGDAEVSLYRDSTRVAYQNDGTGFSPDLSYTFTSSGTFTMKVRCHVQGSQSAYSSPNNQQWTVTVGGPSSSAASTPSIESANVKSSAPYEAGDSFQVETECTNDGDAEVSLYRDGTRVANQNDGTGFSPDLSYTFPSAGAYTMKVRCHLRGNQGAYGSPNNQQWTVSVASPTPTPPPSPSIESANVKSSSPYRVGDAFRVETECTYDGDAEVSLYRDGTRVANQNDGTGFSPDLSYTFQSTGSYTMKVRCHLRGSQGAYASPNNDQWTVTVINDNQAPSATRSSPSASGLTKGAGESQSFEVACTDPNAGDDLAGNWRLRRDGSTVETRGPNDAAIGGTRGNDWESFSFPQPASYAVEAWCTDASGVASNTVVWTITVNAPTNNPPSAGRKNPSSGSLSVAEGASASLEASCTDGDNGATGSLDSYWTQRKGPGLVDSRTNTASMSGTYGEDGESFAFTSDGTWSVEFYCKDRLGATSNTVAWTITVTSSPQANRAPGANRDSPSNGDLQKAVGESQAFQISCADPDPGDDLSGRWRLRRDGATVENRGPNDADIVGIQGTDQESFTFPSAGNYLVEGWCTDESNAASNVVSWTVPVPPSPSSAPPSIESAVVKSSSPYKVGDAFRVEIECTSDAEAEVSLYQGGARVAYQNDGAGFSPDLSYTFATAGTFTMKVLCHQRGNPNVFSNPNGQQWTLQVPPPSAPPPGIESATLKSSPPTQVGDAFHVEVECTEDADAEVSLYQGDNRVAHQVDGTGFSPDLSHTFTASGTFPMKVRCHLRGDQAAFGQPNDRQWVVTVRDDATSPAAMPNLKSATVRSRAPYEVGETFEVEVDCTQDGDAEASLYKDGTRVVHENDGLGSPNLAYRFASPGTFAMKVRCHARGNEQAFGSPNDQAWTIQVDPVPEGGGEGPRLDWAKPEPGSYKREVGDSFSVEVECHPGAGGKQPFVDFYRDEAILQTDLDVTSPSYSYLFTKAGTYRLMARCRDDTGAHANPNNATWTVIVPEPPSSPGDSAEENEAPHVESANPLDSRDTYYVGDTFKVEVRCSPLKNFADLYVGNSRVLSATQSSEKKAQLEFKFPSAGTFSIWVRCRDQSGKHATPNDNAWKINVQPTQDSRKPSGEHAEKAFFLIHGICSSGALWTGNPGIHITNVLRNHGTVWTGSWGTTNPIEMAEQDRWLRSELVRFSHESLGPDRRHGVTVVGHSMGGLMARNLLRNDPFSGAPSIAEYIEGVVTLDSPDLGLREGTQSLLGVIREAARQADQSTWQDEYAAALAGVKDVRLEDEVCEEQWIDAVDHYLNRGQNWILTLPQETPDSRGETWPVHRFLYADCDTGGQTLQCEDGNAAVSRGSADWGGAVILAYPEESDRYSSEWARSGALSACSQTPKPSYAVVHENGESGGGVYHSWGTAFHSSYVTPVILEGIKGLKSQSSEDAVISCDLAPSIAKGNLGAVVQVGEAPSASKERILEVQSSTLDRGFSVESKAEPQRVTLRVDSEESRPRTVAIDLASTAYNTWMAGKLRVLVDDEVVPMATDLADVLDPTDDGRDEFWAVRDAAGLHVLVSVSHFSTRFIEVSEGDAEDSHQGYMWIGSLGIAALLTFGLMRRLRKE